jgi:hypothetical protein
MSIHFTKNIFILMIFLCLFGQQSFAWSGYEVGNDNEIEIGKGNLVRDGEIIKFYDWEAGEDRRAEVRDVDDNSGGTDLELYDLKEEKVRFFRMD